VKHKNIWLKLGPVPPYLFRMCSPTRARHTNRFCGAVFWRQLAEWKLACCTTEQAQVQIEPTFLQALTMAAARSPRSQLGRPGVNSARPRIPGREPALPPMLQTSESKRLSELRSSFSKAQGKATSGESSHTLLAEWRPGAPCATTKFSTLQL